MAERGGAPKWDFSAAVASIRMHKELQVCTVKLSSSWLPRESWEATGLADVTGLGRNTLHTSL